MCRNTTFPVVIVSFVFQLILNEILMLVKFAKDESEGKRRLNKQSIT